MNFFFSSLFFLSFFTSSMCQSSLSPISSPEDSIIVFTGDSGRIAAGLNLLADDFAPRLLISGVHSGTTIDDLRLAHPSSQDLFDCCITLDYKSTNTRENVVESSRWLDSTNSRSVILVTSDYHMPRSLAEFRAIRPDLRIRPFCTAPLPSDEPTGFTVILSELTKYLIASFRLALSTESE